MLELHINIIFSLPIHGLIRLNAGKQLRIFLNINIDIHIGNFPPRLHSKISAAEANQKKSSCYGTTPTGTCLLSPSPTAVYFFLLLSPLSCYDVNRSQGCRSVHPAYSRPTELLNHAADRRRSNHDIDSDDRRCHHYLVRSTAQPAALPPPALRSRAVWRGHSATRHYSAYCKIADANGGGNGKGGSWESWTLCLENL